MSDIGASNLFALHANFKTQSSSTSEPSTNPVVTDEAGNVDCEKIITDITSYSQSAQYCQSTTYFLDDLGTFLTQFGDVQDSKVVTSLTINMTAGEYCTVDVEGHNHAENAHTSSLSLGYADMSSFFPSGTDDPFENWNGFGVPSLFGTDTEAAEISSTYTLTMTHVDDIDGAGDHLFGKNITPRGELSVQFSGTPTVGTTKAAVESVLSAYTGLMAAAKCDSVDLNDSNSEYDTFAFTAHTWGTLATS